MAIVKAALLLPSANWTAFVAQTCGGDQTMRREVLALLAHDWKPSNLTGGEIVRVSGLFHAAFSLHPNARSLSTARAKGCPTFAARSRS